MSTASICQICESAEARHTCPQCGMSVCNAHYDDEHGLCVRCATTGDVL